MSIWRWLRTTDNPLLLPKAGGDGGVVAANKKVAAVAAAQGENRKTGPYHRYGDELCAKIAKYACENGNKSAVEKFSTQLGYSISEATVRNLKHTYLLKLRAGNDPDAITELPHATLGRLLLIGECIDCCHAGSKQIFKHRTSTSM